MRTRFIFLVIAAGLFYANKTQAQANGITKISAALDAGEAAKAETILNKIVAGYRADGNIDSLVNYIFYRGKISLEKYGKERAVKDVRALAGDLIGNSHKPATLRQTCLEESEFYGSIGMNREGYEGNLQALKYTLQLPGEKGNELGIVENNLATYAQRLGDLSLSQQHTRKAIQHLLAAPKPDFETLYIAYNGMGSAMWYASKTDSALFYFSKALETLKKAPSNPVNQYFRTAILENNLAGLYQLEGNTTKAINSLKTTIENLRKFSASDYTGSKKTSAISFQFEATDNLAGIYKELGDFRKARELLEYSYHQKQQQLTPGDPGIYISQILLGQLYYATHEYNKALQYLQLGLGNMDNAAGDYDFWRADACNTLALLYDAKKMFPEAARYYERADSLYEMSLQGEYDNIYLDFLSNTALFYAQNQQLKKAVAKANKGYDYVVKSQGPQTLTAFYQLLNLSEIYYLSGDYNASLDYSNRSLRVLNKIISNSSNILDSIRIELKKPKAILQNGKARYALMVHKDKLALEELLQQMNGALAILSRQKTLLTDPADIGLLMADHSDLTDFIKKLDYELYGITSNASYIDQIISLHESGIYSRIRARLDQQDTMGFAHISRQTLERDRQLRLAISKSLQGNRSHNEMMREYVDALELRDRFLDTLKKEEPTYYQLRYGSLFKSMNSIQQFIPPNTTLIRYFFIDSSLYAFIVDKKHKNLVPLPVPFLSKDISRLAENGSDIQQVSASLHSLYNQLWKRISAYINTKRVVVIPDGILFNLNFEILTEKPIRNFGELASKSLLASHSFAYHYSLFLLQQKKQDFTGKNIAAFAPGFFDALKNNYRSACPDSTAIDKGYLSLLPQPFSIRLARVAADMMGGNAFMHEQSTKASFMAQAGNHRIIHIGTHAESNNDHPEYSRLIFAKDNSRPEIENSLFVNEIYNCDLRSSLTVLTACESGRPGFQDGEGMISLAHAFNYAGSESMLTALWKIDEQASSVILEEFYRQLRKGLPKDEALRQAKLVYLSHAEGRMLAPQYWAGLIIMGDTSPVSLATGSYMNYWLSGAALIFLIACFAWWKKRSHKKANV